MIKSYKVCTRCVMDTTDEFLTFDERGVCNRCNEFEHRIHKWWNYGKGHEDELQRILYEIKRSGLGKEYDCILGLSGGLDSSYLLHLAVKEWGLRPFVFHVDAGWNLPVAEINIRKICEKLGVELHIEKMDWEEMRQMQLAFFKTGHAGLDAPQDHAFIAKVDEFSEKLGVKYILNGYNISTEIVSNPESWNKGAGPAGDGKYIRDVLRKHGNIKTQKYVYTSGFKHKFWLPYVKGVKTLQLLNYVSITKEQMVSLLQNEYGYEAYPQKHFEDLLTKFIEGWWLPTRFGYDIRKAQLSSLVITGQLSRENAMEILSHPPLTNDEAMELFSEISRKLEISEEELSYYHSLPFKFKRYRNNAWAFKLGIWLYTALKIDKRIRR